MAEYLILTVKLFICSGKDSRRTIRAAMAGFAKLLPIPPNISLITMIATSAPRTGIQSGMEEGMLYARRTPVTTADRLFRWSGVCLTFAERNSNTTQADTVTAVMTRER